jgi:hypothetical protein
MYGEAEEGAIQSDAYIDALLSGHSRLPIALTLPAAAPAPSLRHVIRLLEGGMPRFHPSFLFEERLAGQLRAVADQGAADAATEVAVVDRRLLMGGAIASGVSLAGAAAMVAWLRRPRPDQRRT